MMELLAAYNEGYFGFEYSDGYSPIAELVDTIWDNNKDSNIMTWGYTKRWDGVYHGGSYLDSKEDIENRVSGGRDIEDVRVYRITDTKDEASDNHVGDIVVYLGHHDGTNRYVLRCTKQRKVGSNNVEGFKRQFSRAKALMI